jgi:hypothetical protein
MSTSDPNPDQDPAAPLRDLRRRALSGQPLSSAEYRLVLDSLRNDRLAAAVAAGAAGAAKAAPKEAKTAKQKPPAFDFEADFRSTLAAEEAKPE